MIHQVLNSVQYLRDRMRHFPKRIRNVVRAASAAFYAYTAPSYVPGQVKTYREKSCGHCSASWSTYHNDLYLCEDCVDEYGDDWVEYKSFSVKYMQALYRLKFQMKWYGMEQKQVDNHWWMLCSMWNCSSHHYAFMRLIESSRDQPEAVYCFARHNLDLHAAYRKYQRYEPGQHFCDRRNRLHFRRDMLFLAVQETVESLELDRDCVGVGHGEELDQVWDLYIPTAPWEDQTSALGEYVENMTWWRADELEYFRWSEFVEAFWQSYTTVW